MSATTAHPDFVSIEPSVTLDQLSCDESSWAGDSEAAGDAAAAAPDKGCWNRTQSGISDLIDFLHLRDFSSFVVIIIYSLVGAGLFIWMETEEDLRLVRVQKTKHDSSKAWALSNLSFLVSQEMVAVSRLHLRAWPQQPDFTDADFDREILKILPQLRDVIDTYESAVGAKMKVPKWTIWNSLLYCMSIYTTIGFGVVAPVTFIGRLVTIFYAIIGIPLMLTVMTDIGKLLLKLITKGNRVFGRWWDNLVFWRLPWGGSSKPSRPSKKKHPTEALSEMSREKDDRGERSSSQTESVDSGTELDSLPTAEARPTPTPQAHTQINLSAGFGLMSPGFSIYDGVAEDPATRKEDDEAATEGNGKISDMPEKDPPPVMAAAVTTIGWIFLCGAMFCAWETDWSYFTSFYFIFITVSTIGFGDIYPSQPKWMVISFVFIIVGLSLVTMCIAVVQQKIEQAYMNMLKELLGEYMAMVENQGVDMDNAGMGMVSVFQNSAKAKFLMPLLSKDKARVVMNQFQENAAAQGIVLPDILMDIDPDTGVPAALSDHAGPKKVVKKPKTYFRPEMRDAEVDAVVAVQSVEVSAVAETSTSEAQASPDQTTATIQAVPDIVHADTNTPEVLIEDYAAQVNLTSPKMKDAEVQANWMQGLRAMYST